MLAAHPQVGRIEAIDVNAAHIAEKPENWPYQKLVSDIAVKGGSLMGTAFKSILKNVQSDPAFVGKSENEKITETNRRVMNHGNFKGFRLTKETHEN